MLSELICNENIVAKNVRLIGDDEKTIGVCSLKDALARARAEGLDLVVIATNEVPVVRIMSFNKFKYEQSKLKKEQERKRKELIAEVKEIQLRPVTNANDIIIKARKAKEFLNNGNKVKVIVRFHGREKSYRQGGIDAIDKFLKELVDYKIEKPLSNIDSEEDMVILLGPVLSKADLIKKK